MRACVLFIYSFAHILNAERLPRTLWKSTRDIPKSVSPWSTAHPINASQIPSWIDDQVQRFMKKWNLPSVSFAISANDTLKVVRSYGYANVAQRTFARANTSYRLASCSKPITAMAIFKLIEQGKLRLNGTVYGATGVLGTIYGTRPYNANLRKVTVKHLLLHAVEGWDGDSNDEDPDDAAPELTTTGESISYVLDNYILRKRPGQKSSYCNICYTMLGQVVATVSGQSYEDFVRQYLLNPSGVSSSTRIGASRPIANEATYYQADGDTNPDEDVLTRWQGSGGWVSTPVDYLRLIAHTDLISKVQDIMQRQTIQEMVRADGPDPTQAKGWAIRDDRSWYHDGALAGTATAVQKGVNGISWAIFLNAQPDDIGDDDIYSAMSNLINRIVQRIGQQWPLGDLF